MKNDIDKELEKLLKTNGVEGYSVKEKTITIYVESEEIASTMVIPKFSGYEVNVKVIGKLEAL